MYIAWLPPHMQLNHTRGRDVDPGGGGGGGSRPHENIGGGETCRFAPPPPNNFDNNAMIANYVVCFALLWHIILLLSLKTIIVLVRPQSLV